jgi:hypothetical protein
MNEERLDDIKGVMRIRKPKKDRQRYTKHNTENPLNTGGELMCSEMLAAPAPHVTPAVLLVNDTNII